MLFVGVVVVVMTSIKKNKVFVSFEKKVVQEKKYCTNCEKFTKQFSDATISYCSECYPSILCPFCELIIRNFNNCQKCGFSLNPKNKFWQKRLKE